MADEQVIAAIGTPNAATLRGWAAPTRQHGVQIGTVYTNFPNRGQVGLLLVESESKPSAIGREAYGVRPSGEGNQLPSIGAIPVGRVNVRTLGKSEPAAIR